MSFISQLMSDAQPKVNSLKATSDSITNSAVVKAAKNLSYKGLVNTVGIAAVILKPAAKKTVTFAQEVQQWAAEKK
jgi:hypothetical protein